MPSTSLADYQVLSDTDFTLDANGPGDDSQSFTFDVPDDLTTSTSGARKAVVTFKFRPIEDSQIRMEFQGAELFDIDFDRSITRMHCETFDIGGILEQDLGQPGGLPTLAQFVVEVVSGRVRFGDIVIWYQINR